MIGGRRGSSSRQRQHRHRHDLAVGDANLEVSNAVSGSGTTNVNVTTYSANGFGPNLIGKKARGTQGAPTAVLNNDALLDLSANGYGATGFASVNSAGISMRASENWTDTAQGSSHQFLHDGEWDHRLDHG